MTELTPGEILATLSHSSLPSVLIEGKDDLIAFRRFEESQRPGSISILPVGGRNNILATFVRRSEITSDINILWVADKDFWVNTVVPDEFLDPRLIFWDGYSFENDALRDGKVEGLLHPGEMAAYKAEVTKFIHWYAIEIERSRRGRCPQIKHHPNFVLDDDARYELLIRLEDGEVYPTMTNAELASDYLRLVRGKSLFQILMRHLSCPGRYPKHHHASILESVSVNRGPFFDDMFNAVAAGLKITLGSPTFMD